MTEQHASSSLDIAPGSDDETQKNRQQLRQEPTAPLVRPLPEAVPKVKLPTIDRIPSKQAQTIIITDQVDFLTEISQFVNGYIIHFYYQKQISEQEQLLKQRYLRLHHSLVILKQPEPLTSDQLRVLSILTLDFFTLIQDTISVGDIPSNILKGALKTVSKLLNYRHSLVSYLLQSDLQQSQKKFSPADFLKTLFNSHFDSHDSHQEELIILQIQKIVIKLVREFSSIMTEDDILKCCIYFFRVLRKRVINENAIISLYLIEGTKQNMKKLFSSIFKLPKETHADVKASLLAMFARKLHKNLTKLEELQKDKSGYVQMGDLMQTQEYVSFVFKEFSGCVMAVAEQSDDEFRLLFTVHKELIIKLMCRVGENPDVVLRNFAQQMFSFVLQKVLQLEIPLREEIEVLYTRLILKPLEQLTKKIEVSQLAVSQPVVSPSDKISLEKTESTGDAGFLSDTEDSVPSTSTVEQEMPPITTDYLAQLGFERELYLNILLDVILLLQPAQLAQFYLVYDCQPLSENIIRRSLYLLIKHSQQAGNEGDLSRCFTAVSFIMRALMRYQSKGDDIDVEHTERGIFSLQDMLKAKSLARRLAKAANEKPKAFFAVIDDIYKTADSQMKDYIQAKVLINSRRVQIDKIAEIVGGKLDRNKACLEGYLERQDYADCNVEHSLRSFMQTFRMAGVDSQVVFNILEKFGDKFYEKDHSQMFTSGSEAYNFAYLIIVLQTCQHNAAIKEKSTLERFFTQAKEMVPESYDNLPPGFVEEVFHAVTKQEIKAPASRDLIEGNYDQSCGLWEIENRLLYAAKDGEKQAMLSESQFLSTSDLREKQLFDLNNQILGVAPEGLVQSALRQLVSILTGKICQIRNRVGESRFNQLRTLELTKVLIQANSHFKNYEWVDRLLISLDQQVDSICRIQKFEQDRKTQAQADLQNLFWANFDNLRHATGLISKLAPTSSMTLSQFHYASFNAVETKIRSKFGLEIPLEGLSTRRVYKGDPEVTVKVEPIGGQKVDPDQQLQTSGIFNRMYNYFTPVSQAGDDEMKKKDYLTTGKGKLDILKSQLDEFNRKSQLEYFNSQGSPENVQESYLLDFLSARGLDASKSINKISQYIHENLSSRRATTCLSYLFQVYDDSLASQDIDTSLLVQHTILQHAQKMVHSLTRAHEQSPNLSRRYSESQNSDNNLSDSFDARSEKSEKSDSMVADQPASSPLTVTTLLEKEPKKSHFDREVALQVNKHLALELYFYVSSRFIITEARGYPGQQYTDARPQPNELIKDVQKTLAALGEEELTREDFEQAFVFEKAAQFLKPDFIELPQEKLQREASGEQDANSDHSEQAFDILTPMKEYPKLVKFLRLSLILVHQVNIKQICNNDTVALSIVTLLRNIAELLLAQEPIQYDLINQSVDMILKYSGPFSRFHDLSGTMFEHVANTCDCFFKILEKGAAEHQTHFDLWFKIMALVQSQIILSPYIELYKPIQEKATNLLKNQILSFQFQPSGEEGSAQLPPATVRQQTRSIFEELLFCLTFERLWAEKNLLGQDYLEQKGQWSSKLTQDWEDDLEGFAWLCQLCSNMLTDVFIQYVMSQNSGASESDAAENFEMFSYLWKKFMFALLNYADQAENLITENQEYYASVHPLSMSVQHNIQRVMEFLLSHKLLADKVDDSDPLSKSKHELYQKTKTVLEHFWQESTTNGATGASAAATTTTAETTTTTAVEQV